MTANPAPHPALTRAPDGTVVAAAPRLPVRSDALLTGNLSLSGGKSKKHKGDQDVELVVPMSKAVRKRLRKKAEAQGYTAEDATARLIMAWLESDQ